MKARVTEAAAETFDVTPGWAGAFCAQLVEVIFDDWVPGRFDIGSQLPNEMSEMRDPVPGQNWALYKLPEGIEPLQEVNLMLMPAM